MLKKTKKHLPTTIGIVGGGQLGRMLTIAAKQLGFTVIVIDPTPNSPAGQVADEQIIADYKDATATRTLAKKVDVITVDAEFVDTTTLSAIAKSGIPIFPSPHTIAMIKDKLLQKQTLHHAHIPIAPFQKVTTKKDIEKAAETFAYPILLKARFDAYDGKGNVVIKKKEDIPQAMHTLQGRKLYVEAYIPFVKELAIMVAKDTNGTIAAYPVVETIHKDNICDTVLVPATVSKKIQKKAREVATMVMQHVEGAGVFGIEMFLEKNDTIRINEIAPRVHNSGHYTIEGSITSQFEQHIRAITGLPLGATALIPRAVVMKNILATKKESGLPMGIADVLAIPNVSFHWYGKHEARPYRKMGHITVIGDTMQECLQKAQKARAVLHI